MDYAAYKSTVSVEQLLEQIEAVEKSLQHSIDLSEQPLDQSLSFYLGYHLAATYFELLRLVDIQNMILKFDRLPVVPRPQLPEMNLEDDSTKQFISFIAEQVSTLKENCLQQQNKLQKQALYELDTQGAQPLIEQAIEEINQQLEDDQ